MSLVRAYLIKKRFRAESNCFQQTVETVSDLLTIIFAIKQFSNMEYPTK